MDLGKDNKKIKKILMCNPMLVIFSMKMNLPIMKNIYKKK